MQRISSMHAFGRGRGARPPGMRVGNLDAQVRAALFAQGQGGYMLSFDRAEALYQDTVASSQASAAGNPLALVLDQKAGLVRGPELCPGGDFSNPALWTKTGAGAGIAEVSGGQAQVLSTDGGYLALFYNGPSAALSVGTLYEVSFDVISAQGAGIRVDIGGVAGQAFNSIGRQTVRGIAANTTSVTFVRGGGANSGGIFDNVSVRAISGNHFQQATATARPTRQQDAQGYWYANFDGTDDGLSSVTNVDETPFGYATTFMGVVLPTSDTTRILHETSNASASNNGATAILIDSSGLLASRTRGSAEVIVSGPTRVAGQKYLLTQIASVATSANGFVVNDTGYSNTAPPGGSVLGNYPHNLSIRPGSLYLNSQIRAVIRVASVAPLGMTQRAVAQAWVRSKMGA